MNALVSFFNEVRAELKKVSWPTRTEVVGSAIIVCVVVLIFSIILSGMDTAFSAAIRYLLQ